MEQKKIKLDELRVESFVTNTSAGEKDKVVGAGYYSDDTSYTSSGDCLWCYNWQGGTQYCGTDWGSGCATESAQHSCYYYSCYTEGQDSDCVPTCDALSYTCTPGVYPC